MSDDVQSPIAARSEVSISQSVWPARIVVFVFGMLSIVSLILFAYQVRLETYPGSGRSFGSTAAGALHVGEHLLRGVISLVLALGTLKYLRVLRGLSETLPAQMQTTLVMLWRTLAVSLVLFLTYGVARVILINSTFLMQPEPEDVIAEQPVPEVIVEFRLAGTTVEDVAFEAPVAERDETVWLHTNPLLTNEHISKAVAKTSDHLPDGSAQIMLEFTPEGAKILERASNLHLGRRIAVVLDGQVVMAPQINSPLSSQVSIDLPGYSPEDVQRIARSLVSVRPKSL